MKNKDNLNSLPESEGYPVGDNKQKPLSSFRQTRGADSEKDEAKTRLFDLWNVIKRRYWIIIAFFITIVSFTTIITFKMPLIYQAVATLRIYTENPKVLKFEEVITQVPFAYEADSFYRTQYGILRSRSLARGVIEELNLVSHPEFIKKEGKFLRGLADKIVSLTRKSEYGYTDNEGFKMTNTIDLLLEKIEIEPIRKSQLVDVKINTKYPELSADICNTLVSQYIQGVSTVKSATETSASRELAEQLESLRAQLEKSEIALNTYARDNDIIALEEKKDALYQRITGLITFLTEAKVNRIASEAQYLQLENGGSIESLGLALNDKLLNDLYIELNEAKAEYSSQMQRIKGNHPLIAVLSEKLNNIKESIDIRLKAISDNLKAEYEEAILKEKGLLDEFEELKKERALVEEKSVKYKMLARDVDSNAELYKGLLQRMKETNLSSEVKTTNIQIVDNAEIPKRHYKPKRMLNVLLSVIMGLILGVLLAFLFDYLDNTIRLPSEVETRLRMPLLGYVPMIKDLNGTLQRDLISHKQPKSLIAEAYRTIRTGILFSSPDSKINNIMITSAFPSEGKTITTINLAITLAQSGHRVLLVDTDLRRPRIHKVFGIKNDLGICNILISDTPVDDVIKQTDIPNLDILASGSIHPSPAELLGSKKMDSLIHKLNERYEKVLFDSSPITSVTDAAILATKVDVCIVVILAGKTDISGILHGKNLIQNVGGRIIGVILNGVSKIRHKYYYHSYYYYGHDDEKKKKLKKKRQSGKV